MTETVPRTARHQATNGSQPRVMPGSTIPVTSTLRVAQVSTWDTPCGIADYTASLLRELQVLGVDCRVAPIDRRRLKYLSTQELHDHYSDLARQLADAEVVHIHHDFGFYEGQNGMAASIDVFGGFLGALIRQRTPTLVTFHTNPVFLAVQSSDLRHRAVRLYYRGLWRASVARRINNSPLIHGVVHSRNTRLGMIRSGVAGRRLTVLPMAAEILPPAAPGAGTRLRRELDIPEGATVLGMFGFMSPYKGYETALESLRHLPEDVHLLILGAPHPFSTESALDNILAILDKRRALKPRVHLAGYVESSRIPAYQAVVDICLAPYHPVVGMSASAALMWAVASGKPVVATKIPAFAELNEAYDCLHLASPSAGREIAFRVQEVMAHDDLRQRLIANARSYCQEYTWADHALHCLDLYRNLKQSR